MIDLPWPSPLRPFQVEGVAALLAHEALLLADDMGLGKTIQCIAALRILLPRRELQRVLIVAPAGLLTQWRRELHVWAPEITVLRVEGSRSERAWKWKAEKQVLLASYETVRSDAGVAMSRSWDLVVLDEAQRIKNRQARVSQVCKRLPRHRAWALTGTPLENAVDDLASVLEFVRPNPSGQRMLPVTPGMRMRSLHLDLQLRRRKADVLDDLPPKTVIRVPLDLAPEQRASYDAMEGLGRLHLQDLGSAATVINVLELITRLKQICNFCPDSGRSAKLDDLRERLVKLRATEHRALLFSQWKSDAFGVQRLSSELSAFEPLCYTGDLSMPARAAVIEQFRRDRRHGLLLLSLRAGGQGLNLQEASYVFHFDRWWNPAVENQATDRAHRMGQKQAVTVYAYSCVDTIEERIEEILDRKRELFADLVDGVSIDPCRLLSDADLFGLFGLAAPPRRATRTPSAGAAAVRVQALLERGGWKVRATPHGFAASHWDEVGLPREARVHIVTERMADVDDVAALEGEGLDRRVVMGERGFSDAARRMATECGVVLWTLDDLAQLEAAVRADDS